MSFLSFISDQAAVRDRGDWLIELYPKDLSGVETPIRFSRRGTSTTDSAVTIGSDSIGAHKMFRKRLLKPPVMTQSIWSPGQMLSSSLPTFGEAVFNNQDRELDQYRNWTFAGCRFKTFFCDMDDVAGTIGKIGDGIMGRPDFGISVVKIPFNGRESLFLTPLSTRVYRGTGGMLELFGDRTTSFGSPAATNITGNMSAEGWLYLHDPAAAAVQFWGYIGSARIPWRIDILNTGALRFVCTHSVGTVVAHSTAKLLSTRRWYHFAFTISSSTLTSIIWDDDAQTTTTETFSIGAVTRDAQFGGTYLLRSGNDASFRPWFDDLKVYNTYRSPSEIAADRFREISTVPAALIHYLKLNDGAGTTVIDSSASAVNGTISGAGVSTWLHSQEGGPELAGIAKPDCYGERFGCAPVLVDPVRQGFQVAGAGAIQDVLTYEGGVPHTMIASAASLRAYLTTTPAAGTSLRYLPRGLFKLGSAPTLPVSATVYGYNDGLLGYVNKGDTITRDIITRRGPKIADPGGLDTASFTAYNAANPGIIGYFNQRPTPEDTIGSLLDLIMKSGAGFWGYVRASTLFYLKKFAGPSAVADYNFKPQHIIRDSLQPVIIESVIWKVVVQYRHNNVKLSEDQVAASIKSTANWQQWTLEWQEKEDHDDAIHDQFPGNQSSVLTVQTLLQYDTDAQALATYLLGLLKGKKQAWQVSVGATGLEATIDETASLTVYHQDQVIVLGLDGSVEYSILTITDNRQEAQNQITIWGSVS